MRNTFSYFTQGKSCVDSFASHIIGLLLINARVLIVFKYMLFWSYEQIVYISIYTYSYIKISFTILTFSVYILRYVTFQTSLHQCKIINNIYKHDLQVT